MRTVDISQWAPDVYLVSLPIPSPLRQVNCYLIRGRHGWTVVDTGFNIPTTLTTWQAAFQALDIAPRQVEKIIATHHHPDHYGAAGWLQQWTGAPVLMHKAEADLVERTWAYENFIAEFAKFYGAHGIPRATLQTVVSIALEVMEQVLPKPTITTIDTDDTIMVGDRACRAIPAPGHSAAVLLLWDEADRLLLASDMILTPISPNVSVDPITGPDPLADYLDSLAWLAKMPARLTLTGHRQPIDDLAGRCKELEDHHSQRLQECERIVADLAGTNGQSGVQAWPVSYDLFGHAVMDNSESGVFALGEAAAHLDHLAYQDRLVRHNDDNGIFYTPLAHR